MNVANGFRTQTRRASAAMTVRVVPKSIPSRMTARILRPSPQNGQDVCASRLGFFSGSARNLREMAEISADFALARLGQIHHEARAAREISVERDGANVLAADRDV